MRQRDGHVRNLELRLKRADGSPMLCLYSGVIIDSEGERRLLSIAIDVTDRRLAEGLELTLEAGSPPPPERLQTNAQQTLHAVERMHVNCRPKVYQEFSSKLDHRFSGKVYHLMADSRGPRIRRRRLCLSAPPSRACGGPWRGRSRHG